METRLMDSSEATKVVIQRISTKEPEDIVKMIIGYMDFQGFSNNEMIRLAFGPDSLINDLKQKAKNALLLALSQVISPPIYPPMNPPPVSDPSIQFPPVPSRPYLSPAAFRMPDPHLDTQLPVAPRTLQNVNYPNEYYGPKAAVNSLSIRGARNASNLMDYPVKICHYFMKGYCKHGSNCRYFHGELLPESYPHNFSPNSYDVAGDDQLIAPGSLDKLELEITELLRSRRGNPVSIASLPMMYCEVYGKTLQAEGYLTESQRHGKAGFSLTKLLARLKNSIRLIDRPHGQHAVILAEDAAKYLEIRAERNDPGPIVNGSRQIYMTFPPESTFTEEDVSNYFSNFGVVNDVRIPCQQKRMFGFITFNNADTVKMLLSKATPHYVCGARVIVKPYREQAKLVERKYMENFGHPVFFQSQPANTDSEHQTGWDSLRLDPRHQLANHLARLHLAGRTLTSQHGMDKPKWPEGPPKSP